MTTKTDPANYVNDFKNNEAGISLQSTLTTCCIKCSKYLILFWNVIFGICGNYYLLYIILKMQLCIIIQLIIIQTYLAI